MKIKRADTENLFKLNETELLKEWSSRYSYHGICLNEEIWVDLDGCVYSHFNSSLMLRSGYHIAGIMEKNKLLYQ